MITYGEKRRALTIRIQLFYFLKLIQNQIITTSHGLLWCMKLKRIENSSKMQRPRRTVKQMLRRSWRTVKCKQMTRRTRRAMECRKLFSKTCTFPLSMLSN
uniref:Uncharacterized protein n=1 Tax=Cacopsylla melanoneura TaxID=428564 RepID=A0A8D8WLL5_9HEMI